MSRENALAYGAYEGGVVSIRSRLDEPGEPHASDRVQPFHGSFNPLPAR